MPIPFVDYGGNQLALLPPYVAENVSLFAFFVQADSAALQRTLDRRLNAPFGAERRFVPAGSIVLVVFNKIGKMYSADPPYRERGWFSEQEAAIWMRVVDTKLEKSFWFHPYMFVDNSYAMALGREVYGFPKAYGFFEIPDTPQDAETFSVKTLALPVYDANTQGVLVELMRARKTDAMGWPDIGAALDFAAEVIGLEAHAGNLAGQLELLLTSIADLEHLEVPMAFLKQFPQGDQPGFACYQSLIEAQATASKMHNLSVVPGKWEIDITKVASHPIADDLGLQGNVVSSLFQLWLNFDMTVGFGKTVEEQTGANAGPKKIAILGGGVGGLTTALELTKEPGWQSRYDITLYQLGWRLGGKGASGRGEYGRIEEHGLHIWLGFYENAFRIIREVYKENQANRAPGTPLREWTEAFQKHSFVALMDRAGEQRGEEWLVWPVHAPEFPGTPGDGAPITWWDSFVRIWGWLEELYLDSTLHRRGGNETRHSGFWSQLVHSFQNLIPELRELCGLDLLSQLFSIRDIAGKMAGDPALNTSEWHKKLATLTWHFREAFRSRMREHPAGDEELRRLYEVFELVTTIAKGLLECGYLLDHTKLDELTQDFQEWLRDQGAEPIACDIKQSCILRGLYDLVFAYHNGEAARPSFEAGVALRSVLLIMGSYKGAIFWKMQAGMGDVVFGPMFEVLRARGVKFKFFHRAEELVLNDVGDSVDSIRLSVQATLNEPGREYQPFTIVEGLPCWPAQPLFDQLAQGDAISKGQFDLESFWTSWENAGTVVLKAGKDYDQVVLAISLGALPFLFSDTSKLPSQFQAMLANVETVATQAVQLWVNESVSELGWGEGSVVLDAYTDPINTWAVMEQLLCRETWPAGMDVKSIHYFCGQMVGDIPSRNDQNAPKDALARVEAAGRDFIERDLSLLLPNLSIDKVVSRYLRANINPTERYVTSVAGSTRYRLCANESGLANVTLAGDWTRNGFNAGCVEAAVMSGIQAANSIAGHPLNEGIDGPLAS